MIPKNTTIDFKRTKSELLKIVNLAIIFLLFLLFFAAKTFSQVICDLGASNNFPPSPYTNAFLKFDGTGDYLKTNDLNELEFDTSATNGFTIRARIKILRVFSPQYILGKHSVSGWILAYHTAEYGCISISFSNGWKTVHSLGNDTNWHDYTITYDKQTKTLRTFADGALTNTYYDFTYGNISNGGAFSVGNVGFLPDYGPESVNLHYNWFKGAIDYIRVSSDSSLIVNYDFNENSGQFAKDSASYFITDRTLPGINSCGSKHLMLGFFPCRDTCDPQWILDDLDKPTDFLPLGGGTRNINLFGGMPMQTPSYSTGMTTWNGNLVNCGNFNMAGETPVKNIAVWNGMQWSSIGNGFNYEPASVIVYNNELYATGFFDTAIGFGAANYIAKWNGTEWKPLGRGLENVGNTMLVYNDELIVGGYFVSAGEVYAPRIASWNGIEWKALGFGMSGPVNALCIYNGELYAGGNFTYAGTNSCNGIAKWDGQNWQPVGSGVIGGDRTVKTLEVFNGELYAGGSFIYMDGVHCSNIARFDGSRWRDLQDGAKGYNCTNSLGYIFDLEVLDNELYAAGLFTRIGTISANKLAKWNGNSWCSVEYGIELLPRSLEAYNGSLYINGDFYSISGREYSNIAKYTPGNLTGTVSNNIPVESALEQNYPNPFNPVTTIKYKVNKAAIVSIIVYDNLGRKVSEPVKGRQHNAGSYEFQFNGSDLASGVYFYSYFLDGKMTATRKMLLIK